MRQTVALVKIMDAPNLDKKERKSLSDWLKEQAASVLVSGDAYDTHYTGKFELERRIGHDRRGTG